MSRARPAPRPCIGGQTNIRFISQDPASISRSATQLRHRRAPSLVPASGTRLAAPVAAVKPDRSRGSRAPLRVIPDAVDAVRDEPRGMGGHLAPVGGSARFAERVAFAALVAVPVVVGLGVVAMIISPEAFAETEPTAGGTPWGGAVAGLAMFLAVTALPLGLFSWALRARRRSGLILTAAAAPYLAVFAGLLPLAGALVEGWDGLSPLAVVLAAGCAVADGFVLAAALRELRGPSPGG